MSLPLVELRPIETSNIFGHLPETLRWRNDPRVYKWCRQREPISIAHHEAYWARVENDSSVKMFGVFTSASRILVGVTGLTSIDLVNRRAEFSLYINPNEQGRGYGEAGLRAICDYGFQVLGLNCIWGESFAGNPAVAIFKRVGFRHEGVRREFYYRNGGFIDANLWSLLRRDYDLRRYAVSSSDMLIGRERGYGVKTNGKEKAEKNQATQAQGTR